MTGSRPLKLVDFDEVQRTDAAIEELASRRGESGHSSDPALLILDELIADVDEREPILRAVGSPGSARRTRRGRRGRFIAALGIGVVIAGGSTGVAVAGQEIFDDLHTPPPVESVQKGGDGRPGGSGEEIEAGVAPPPGGANAVRPPRASRERPGVPGEEARRPEPGKLDRAGGPGKGLNDKVGKSTGKTGPEVDTGVDVDTDTGADMDTTDSGKDASTDAKTDSTNAKSKSKSKGKGRKVEKQASTPDTSATAPANGRVHDGAADDAATDDAATDDAATDDEADGRAADDGATDAEDSGEMETAAAPPAPADDRTGPAATDSGDATEETGPVTAHDAEGDSTSAEPSPDDTSPAAD